MIIVRHSVSLFWLPLRLLFSASSHHFVFGQRRFFFLEVFFCPVPVRRRPGFKVERWAQRAAEPVRPHFASPDPRPNDSVSIDTYRHVIVVSEWITCRWKIFSASESCCWLLLDLRASKCRKLEIDDGQSDSGRCRRLFLHFIMKRTPVDCLNGTGDKRGHCGTCSALPIRISETPLPT